MNRRNFFKNLGAAIVGVILAPAVVKAIENISKPKREGYMNVDWDKVRKESMGIEKSELIFSAETRRKLYARYANVPTVWDGFRLIGRSGV